jgi:hypothetical protein
MMGINCRYLAACAVAFLSLSNANADSIPYANVGHENADIYSFSALETGEVDAYFYGSTAGYTNTISMLVNGQVTPETAAGVLNNHSSSIGQFVNLGSVTAGDVITFRLNVLSTGDTFYSNKSMNFDGVNHVYATSFSGDVGAKIPAGTYLAFEDLRGGGDLNYHDENFVFTNIAAAVPEPESFAMMMAGLGLLGFVARRRKSS